MLRPVIFCLIAAFSLNLNASVNIPKAPQSETVLLKGATVHPISKPKIQNGWVLLKDGKIRNIGSAKENTPKADRVIDLTGKHLYPGLIAANSSLGLVEVGAVRSTDDQTEVGLVNPNVKAQVAVNPDSELFPVTRANGVLFALTVPQGGLVTGRSALLQLDGWTWEEMTLASPVGLHVQWPDMRHGTGQFNSELEDAKEFEKQLQQTLKLLRNTFEQAKAYHQARTAGRGKLDSRWEAMRPVFAGKMSVYAHANDIRQMNHAMHLAKEFGFQLVIVGGQDAWRIADTLKAEKVAVIISPIHTVPLRRWDAYDAQFTNAAKLFDAGVEFCIAHAGGGFAASNQRNLPYHAATAAAFGLPKEEALKAITLYPAQILGVADRIGSIEVGKDATLFVSNGDPLEIGTQVEKAYIEGREIDLSSRHTRLYEKYQEKYRQLRGESKKD